MDSTYNEFGFSEHLAIMSRFLCTIIDSNAKKFSYNKQLPTMSSFFCIFLLVVSGTKCKYIHFIDTEQQ